MVRQALEENDLTGKSVESFLYWFVACELSVFLHLLLKIMSVLDWVLNVLRARLPTGRVLQALFLKTVVELCLQKCSPSDSSGDMALHEFWHALMSVSYIKGQLWKLLLIPVKRTNVWAAWSEILAEWEKYFKLILSWAVSWGFTFCKFPSERCFLRPLSRRAPSASVHAEQIKYTRFPGWVSNKVSL